MNSVTEGVTDAVVPPLTRLGYFLVKLVLEVAIFVVVANVLGTLLNWTLPIPDVLVQYSGSQADAIKTGIFVLCLRGWCITIPESKYKAGE